MGDEDAAGFSKDGEGAEGALDVTDMEAGRAVDWVKGCELEGAELGGECFRGCAPGEDFVEVGGEYDVAFENNVVCHSSNFGREA